MIKTGVVTYRGFAARLVALGMVTEPKAAEFLADTQDPDEELPAGERPRALVDLGAAVAVHTDDVGLDGLDLVDAYEEILVAAAACSGGSVVVENVEMAEQEDEEEGGDYLLTFTKNGEPLSWHLDDFGDYLDTLAVFEMLNALCPAPRDFHCVTTGSDQIYVPASETQLAVLTGELGLSFDT